MFHSPFSFVVDQKRGSISMSVSKSTKKSKVRQSASGQNAMDCDDDRMIIDFTGDLDVPYWQPSTGKCSHCGAGRKKRLPIKLHNCRLCGFQFCDLCTGKYHVQKQFCLKQKFGAFSCEVS